VYLHLSTKEKISGVARGENVCTKMNVNVTWFQKLRTLNCLKTPNQLAAQIITKGIDLYAMGPPK
jgi:hypothetical protein